MRLNKLLSSEDRLKALANIGVYFRAGDFRFADGAKAVRVEAGTLSAPCLSIEHSFYLMPDMTKSVAKNEFLRLLVRIRTRIPQGEVNEAMVKVRVYVRRI